MFLCTLGVVLVITVLFFSMCISRFMIGIHPCSPLGYSSSSPRALYLLYTGASVLMSIFFQVLFVFFSWAFISFFSLVFTSFQCMSMVHMGNPPVVPFTSFR